MVKLCAYHILFFLGCFITPQPGHCVVEESIPERGSTVAGGEGESVSFYCRVLNEVNGTQATTEWFIERIDAGSSGPQTIVPDSTFNITGEPLPSLPAGLIISSQTNLTIQNLTSDLDRANLSCGLGGTPITIGADFTLRIYRPPDLNDEFEHTVIENSTMEIDVSGSGEEAFPFPQRFQWMKDGVNVTNSSRISYGYPTVVFENVLHEDIGNYTLSATNFRLDNESQQVGNDTGSFFLNVFSTSPTPTQRPPGGLMVGDPHYSILLPNGQLLCFTVHGQSGFSFNLISNKQMHMNALFVQDPKREEITWIGSLGVVVRGTRYKNSNITKLRFDASEKKIYIGDKVTLLAQKVERLTFSKGKLNIAEFASKPEHPVVHVDLQDVGLSLTVRFKRFHLDIIWNKVDKQPKDTHGLIGQFFREGIEIDESRRLLLLGPDMEPVPVMRKPVWSFMERETPEDQLCWAAMNPGYQGKRLIQGHYLDYLVDDVLFSNFKFGQPNQKKK